MIDLVRDIQPVLSNEEFAGVDRGELGVVIKVTTGTATLERKGLNDMWIPVADGVFSADAEFWLRCNGSTKFRFVITGTVDVGIER